MNTQASIESLVDGYFRWLRDKTKLNVSEKWAEITTPFLDRHNDYIQIYISAINGGKGLLLTDDGETLDDLAACGCNVTKGRRAALLATTLRSFGVKNVDGILQIEANATNFSLKKHNFIQTILAVNDLFFTSKTNVESFFTEDVAMWLDNSGVRYSSNIELIGKSTFSHHFDFVIPKSHKAPERIVKAINNPDKGAAQNLAFAWMDIKDIRANDARMYAVLNDTIKQIPSGVLDALRSYDVIPISWGERQENVDVLAA